MLTNKEKKKIIELHAEGYSNNKIHIETGHAPKTIKDVFKEEEERIKHKKGGNKNADKPQEQKKDADNPIDTTRKIIEGLENLVKTGQQNTREKKKQEKLLEQLRLIIREEIDERIPGEIEKAIAENNRQWNERLDQQYVKKENAADLEYKINTLETTITHLQNELSQKDHDITTTQSTLFYKQQENMMLGNQLQILLGEKNGLQTRNIELYNHIENMRKYKDLLEEKEKMINEENETKKTDLIKFEKEQETHLNKWFFELVEEQKTLEKKQEKFAEQEAKSDVTRKKFYQEIEELLNIIRIKLENPVKLEKAVIKWCEKHENK